jgi:uncharacterized protein (DUF1697 family)
MSEITYVALLRGINVGRAKRVAMADLRALVEAIGYRDVRTLLNSGNIVFTGPKAPVSRVAGSIEVGLASRLGVSARVTVLTSAELAAIVSANPLVEVATNPSRLLVAIPATAGHRRRLEPLRDQDWRPEALAIGKRAAYLWCPEGVIVSRVAGEIDGLLRDAVTTRNWNTITKLRDLSLAPPTSDARCGTARRG